LSGDENPVPRKSNYAWLVKWIKAATIVDEPEADAIRNPGNFGDGMVDPGMPSEAGFKG